MLFKVFCYTQTDFKENLLHGFTLRSRLSQEWQSRSVTSIKEYEFERLGASQLLP